MLQRRRLRLRAPDIATGAPAPQHSTGGPAARAPLKRHSHSRAPLGRLCGATWAPLAARPPPHTRTTAQRSARRLRLVSLQPLRHRRTRASKASPPAAPGPVVGNNFGDDCCPKASACNKIQAAWGGQGGTSFVVCLGLLEPEFCTQRAPQPAFDPTLRAAQPPSRRRTPPHWTQRLIPWSRVPTRPRHRGTYCWGAIGANGVGGLGKPLLSRPAGGRATALGGWLWRAAASDVATAAAFAASVCPSAPAATRTAADNAAP